MHSVQRNHLVSSTCKRHRMTPSHHRPNHLAMFFHVIFALFPIFTIPRDGDNDLHFPTDIPQRRIVAPLSFIAHLPIESAISRRACMHEQTRAACTDGQRGQACRGAYG